MQRHAWVINIKTLKCTDFYKEPIAFSAPVCTISLSITLCLGLCAKITLKEKINMLYFDCLTFDDNDIIALTVRIEYGVV